MNPEIRLNIIKIVNKALDTVTVLAVVAIPLFFMPITAEMFTINKHLLMFSLAGLALLLWAAGFVAEGKIRITASPLLAPLGLLAVSAAVSIWTEKSALAESLIDRGGWLIAILILFAVGSSRSPKLAGWIRGGLILAGSLIGLSMLLGFSGVLAGMKISWLSGKVFSLTGSLLSGLLFLATVFPLVMKQLTIKDGKNDAVKKLSLAVAGVLMAAGIIVSAIQIYPAVMGSERSNNGIMPLAIGWQVAIETMKEKPFFGVGPAGYMAAYTQYRPISTNTADLWAQRFQSAPNELLQIFTTMGLVGLAALLFLIWKLIKLTKYDQAGNKDGLTLATGIMLVSLLLLPLNVVSISLLTSLLILMTLSIKGSGKAGSGVYDATLGLVALKEGLLKVENTPYAAVAVPQTRQTVSTTILPWIFLIPAAAISILILWMTGRVWAAEVNYRQALMAFNANDGTGAYNSLIKTLNWNPWIPLYHRQYADVNLRLANALAAKQDLSDQDRTNVNQLIQQSIREGKLAAQINPKDVQNWETLARIYRSLIKVAEGAENWTVVAYTEAIKVDPINPALRLELGGIFYNLEDWESAAQNFQAAVSLKPDYANGYYNLALAYEKEDKISQAIRAMQATLQNIKADSPDYDVAQNKLKELVDKAGKQPAEKPSGESPELSAPETLPTPLPGANRVKLGETEAPPVTPSPSAAPTGTVTVTPTPTE